MYGTSYKTTIDSGQYIQATPDTDVYDHPSMCAIALPTNHLFNLDFTRFTFPSATDKFNGKELDNCCAGKHLIYMAIPKGMLILFSSHYSAFAQIGTDNNWDRIYAGGNTTTVGVKSDGSVWVWGTNDFGQFGNGTLNQGSTVPLQNNALCTLGVADFDDEKGSVSFYPNPAQDVVQFTYNELPNAKFEVFDLNGRLMYQTKTIGFRGQLAIPVAQWSRGVYVFKIVSENREIIKKMVLN
jgi:hypothetical protein